MSAATNATAPPVVIERDPKVKRNERLKNAATYLLLIIACTPKRVEMPKAMKLP